MFVIHWSKPYYVAVSGTVCTDSQANHSPFAASVLLLWCSYVGELAYKTNGFQPDDGEQAWRERESATAE